MQEAAQSVLSRWESYYVIVGSSGAALTGLQFVVIALVAEMRPRTSEGGAIAAFGTPTVVHFCMALFVAAVLSAPWHGLMSVAVALGLCGACGVAYAVVVTRRARRQTDYKPVFEDWLWHTALPLIAYATLLGSGLSLVRHAEAALFPVGAAVLLLLFIGIHNAWDTVTYVTLTSVAAPETSDALTGRPAQSPAPARPPEPVR